VRRARRKAPRRSRGRSGRFAHGFGELSLFSGISLGPSAPDGQGGLWAVAKGLSSAYAHFSNEHWTIWRGTNAPPVPGMTTERTTSGLNDTRSVAVDGKGGVYVDGTVHIDHAGVARPAKINPGGKYRKNVAAIEPRSGTVLVAENLPPFEVDPGTRRLLTMDAEGKVARAETLPLPPALGAYTGGIPVSMSVAGDRIWLVMGMKLFCRTGEDWTVYWSPKAVQVTLEGIERARIEHRRETLLGAAEAIGGGAAVAAGGAYLASRIKGERYLFAGGEVLAGTVMASMPFWGLEGDEVLIAGPTGCVAGGQWGPVSCLFFVGQTSITSLAAGGGTWATAGALEDRVPSGGALGGSIAGALVGTLTASLFGNLVYRYLPAPLRIGIMSGLIGSGATFGYQLTRR
jgi:hypothetical protein